MPSWLQFLGQGKRERASFLCDDALYVAQDLRFLLRADEAVHFPATLEYQQGRDTLDPEARRGHGVLIHVEFGDPHPAGQLDSQLFHHWPDLPARSAPWGPHVDQHRQRRTLHLVCKVCVGDRYRFGTRGQRLLATSANRFESGLEFLRGHPIRSAAIAAAHQLWFHRGFWHIVFLPAYTVMRSRALKRDSSASFSKSAFSLDVSLGGITILIFTY